MKIDEKGLEAACRAAAKAEAYGKFHRLDDVVEYVERSWKRYQAEVRTAITAYESARSAEAGTVEQLMDKIEGLEADLTSAVEVAYRRGAVEWVRLNYPRAYAVLSAPAPGLLSLAKDDEE